MLSRVKVAAPCIFRLEGDLLSGTPLGIVVNVLDGTSMVKLSREGRGNGLEDVPVADGGESPVDEGGILSGFWKSGEQVSGSAADRVRAQAEHDRQGPTAYR
jgi:hypothetical protein